MDFQDQADAATSADVLHLVVGAGRHRVAIALTAVREILTLPRVFPMPNGPAHVRGFIDLRGGVLPTYDLRSLLGLPSRTTEIEELLELLAARAEDHRAWVRELERSVRERAPFALARDPHACKFGKWYDTYQPENVVLEFLWPRFDEPHRRIHALADEVCGLARDGDEAEAIARIEVARGSVLKRMLDLFEQARAGVRDSSRELAVVLVSGDTPFAVTVDLADGITELGEEQVTDLAALGLATATLPIRRTARRPDNGETVLVLDAARLLGAASSGESAAVA